MSTTSSRSTAPSEEAWALQLPLADAAGVLGPLRLLSGIEIGVVGDVVWLRGRRSDEAVARALLVVPATARYVWMEGDALRRRGSRLVTEQLPSVRWMALRDYVQVLLPVPAFGGGLLPPVALELVRSGDQREANAWLTDMTTWLTWVMGAPAVRLSRLRYAATPAGSVLVIGVPTPSIPGRAMIEMAGVIVPTGFGWTPKVSPAVVRKVVGAADGDRILWDERGARVLPDAFFVPATRASVRATAEAWGGASS